MELQKHFNGKIQDSLSKVALWLSYWCRAIYTRGSAGRVGKWAKEALGLTPSPDVCYAQWLSWGNMSWLWLWTQQNPSTTLPLKVCCGQREMLWSLPCAQQGETLLGLGSAGVPRKPSSGLPMATPGDPLSYLSSATCGHWETFVCAVCSKGGMVLVGTAQLWGKYSGSKCRSHWCWWKHFSWSRESGKWPSAFPYERRVGKNLKALKKQVCLCLLFQGIKMMITSFYLCLK